MEIIDDLDIEPEYASILHGTISNYKEHLEPNMNCVGILNLISLSEEFKDVTVRQEEKVELANIAAQIPMQNTMTYTNPSTKVYVLLQASIRQFELEGKLLEADLIKVSMISIRLVQAIFEIVLMKGWLQLSVKALNLGMKIKKRIGGGQNLLKFPTLDVVSHVRPITPSVLQLELKITPAFQWDKEVHGCEEPFWVIVGDGVKERILHHKYFLLKEQYADEVHTINFTVPMYEPRLHSYSIHVLSDRWWQHDEDRDSKSVKFVSLADLNLPKMHPPPKKSLQDWRVSAVTVLKNPIYESFYRRFRCFNSVQTYSFNKLYHSDDNVLVAAPTGSGKTICAEFAILRNHNQAYENMMVVYIAPLEALAKERYQDWKKTFERGLGIRVVELTGDTVTDLKLLEKGQIIVSTPEKWDALSCRSTHRNYMCHLSLFIISELHLIGNQGGQVLEAVVSRMRFFASQPRNRIRIVALSSAISNANDFRDLIGANTKGTFSFPPSFRHMPLEVYIRGVNTPNFEAAFKAMVKPAYTETLQQARKGCPVLVFVPTRKHALQTALDMRRYLIEDNAENTIRVQELDISVDNIERATLRNTIKSGIGYLHGGLCMRDKEIVKTLFENRQLQVCVVASSMCSEVSLSAGSVVVIGTHHYDYRENLCNDYYVADLQHMMGRAGRLDVDNYGKCVIFCHGPQKEYYKNFLSEAFPVESHLHHHPHKHLNAEVVVEVVRNMDEAIMCLDWTFLVRRLVRNPRYYNIEVFDAKHIIQYQEDLVNNTFDDLIEHQCVEKSNDDLVPQLLGYIAAKHYISSRTVQLFASLTSKPDLEALILTLAAASVNEHQLLLRLGEEELIYGLNIHQRFSIASSQIKGRTMKSYALLLAHLHKQQIDDDLLSDQEMILKSTRRIIAAMVDVLSLCKGWLSVSLLAMNTSQLFCQKMWENDSPYLQFPHFTEELAKRCQEQNFQTIFDFVNLNFEEQLGFLELPQPQLLDVVQFGSILPKVQVTLDTVPHTVTCGCKFSVRIILSRFVSWIEEACLEENELWWLVVGDNDQDELIHAEQIDFKKKYLVELDLYSPEVDGVKTYTVYLKCDFYIGLDQVHQFTVNVVPNV